MRKKELVLIGVLIVLGVLYVHFFTHWFEKKEISITASLRPSRRPNDPDEVILFALNGPYRLTTLKVLPFDGDKFNPQAIPTWSLVSTSNSAPVREFHYGQHIRGMEPAMKGVHPDPLIPGTVYRLIVAAGDATGHKDFKAQ